jgi:hypothetical protein
MENGSLKCIVVIDIYNITGNKTQQNKARTARLTCNTHQDETFFHTLDCIY